MRVDGHDVRDLTLPSLRHHIGMVLDEPFLFSVSIRDNIAYGRPDASFEDVEAAAIAAGADDFIRALPEGYDTVVGERGFTLSGGQRQRISIARTLLVNPPILVLDDATSAIDVQIEQQIHEALRGLMTDRTTLIIAHRLSTISLADRVAVVEGGRVIAEGTHAELLATEPRYAEILAQSERGASTTPTRPPADGAADAADDGCSSTTSTSTSPSRATRRRRRSTSPSSTPTIGATREGSTDGLGRRRRCTAAARRWAAAGGRRLAGQPRATGCRSPASRRRCGRASRSCWPTSPTVGDRAGSDGARSPTG